MLFIATFVFGVHCLRLVADKFVSSLKKEPNDEATELLRQAVAIGERWFEKDPAHEKLALWRNKLAKSFTHQARREENSGSQKQGRTL